MKYATLNAKLMTSSPVNLDDAKFQFLTKGRAKKVLIIGETLLGIPQQELGIEYVKEIDRYIMTLESYLRKDVKTLFWLFCSRFAGLFVGRSLKPFTKMSMENRELYLKRWMESKIPILRTSYVTLRALCSWSYYSLPKSFEEIGFPGETLGREHELPTLLYGKQPLDPKSYQEDYP